GVVLHQPAWSSWRSICSRAEDSGGMPGLEQKLGALAFRRPTRTIVDQQPVCNLCCGQEQQATGSK
ncbi:MAG: hypothetical protein NT069_27575, partial [Planctomycetota bacterium]|nr:hypothetical protein [Planctomycetota bacterium]